MDQPIVYVDVSTIRPGKLEELVPAFDQLTRFVEENMPRLLSYGFFLDDERTTMTVVAVHPDSASLEHHLDTGRDEFRRFGELIELSRIDVYGAVSEDVRARLQQKADMLGTGIVNVHELHAGFAR